MFVWRLLIPSLACTATARLPLTSNVINTLLHIKLIATLLPSVPFGGSGAVLWAVARVILIFIAIKQVLLATRQPCGFRLAFEEMQILSTDNRDEFLWSLSIS